MSSSALIAKKFLFFFTMGSGDGSVAQLTPSEVSLLIRIYSDFIPKNNCKPVFLLQ
jgi:hypothetical protein